MRNKKFFAFVLITIIMQTIFTTKFDLINTQFPFLDGVPITFSRALEYKYLLNWFLPIVGMSFYFSGYISNLAKTQSIVFFIRSYSKTKWVIKQYLHLIMILFLFITFQMVVFTFMGLEEFIFSMNIVKSFCIYFFMLFTLFSIQQLLELYIKSEIAHLIINIYIILSILLTTESNKTSKVFNYLFLSNYGMGFRNGLSQIQQFDTHAIDYFSALVILFIIQIIVIGLSIRRIKKMDLI